MPTLVQEAAQASSRAPPASRFAGSASGAAGVSQALSPQTVLHENEIVILMIRPSVWYIFISSGGFNLVVIAAALLGETSHLISRFVAAPAMATIVAILLACSLLYSVMDWIGHHYILTNCRILTIKGLLQPRIIQTCLGRVRKIALTQSVPERLLKTGTLAFTYDEQPDACDTWVWISNPRRVEQQIHKAINRYTGRTG